MKKPPKKITPLPGKGDKKPHLHSNSASAQRQRLYNWLKVHRMIDTIRARKELDILMPAARVHELRHRYGYQIDLVWVYQPTDCGRLHRVALYVLQTKVCHD